MLREPLQSLFRGESLSRSEATRVMNIMISTEDERGEIERGESQHPQIANQKTIQMAALMGALRAKGETIEELVGFATAVREQAVPVQFSNPSFGSTSLIDTCGTGGDGSGTFNISTAVAFVVSAVGPKVAKHGNRAVSSQSGSADVLEALGIRIDRTPEETIRMIEEIGFGFLFAPRFHPSFKSIEPVRKALGVRTFFNLMGPLVNPARVKRQVLGVSDPSMRLPFAKILQELGSEEAIVVSADDGLDEISISSQTQVSHLKCGKITNYSLDPEELGFRLTTRDELLGGSPICNARIIEQILRQEDTGPKRDVVLLNSAAAFQVSGCVSTIQDGIQLARESILSGKALDQLNRVRSFI